MTSDVAIELIFGECLPSVKRLYCITLLNFTDINTASKRNISRLNRNGVARICRVGDFLKLYFLWILAAAAPASSFVIYQGATDETNVTVLDTVPFTALHRATSPNLSGNSRTFHP